MFNTEVKRIFIPTDFSDCSEEAVEYAISLAQVFQARVFLLHVMEPVVYGLDFSVTHPGAEPTVRQRLGEMMQQRVEKIRGLGIEAEGHFVTGTPFVEIIKAAQKHAADLIIMGTHGRTGLAHILLGSTAERVIQRARCPVLTVKAEGQISTSLEKVGAMPEQAPSGREDLPAAEGVTYCHLCARPSQDIICEACKVRVQAEAFEKKQRVEKEGRIETGRR
jgi:nucleotide-binding universal stress UspA family protein